ncbi:MAG: GNAT family N-acetyltransferase [Desulfobacteraceae bacterium]|nr:MAG: GNAT family N-acetyltransferase [Desulfobacteraceae bacterium]
MQNSGIKKFRRRGISKELMRTVIHHARNQAYQSLRLETYSCLTNAREFYKRIGFQLKVSNKDVKKYGQVFDQEFWELKL